MSEYYNKGDSLLAMHDFVIEPTYRSHFRKKCCGVEMSKPQKPSAEKEG
jgi:hypothetical protein